MLFEDIIWESCFHVLAVVSNFKLSHYFDLDTMHKELRELCFVSKKHNTPLPQTKPPQKLPLESHRIVRNCSQELTLVAYMQREPESIHIKKNVVLSCF